MRWEDERYVRLYTRDTAEWLALGWQAQALLVLLLRKADRAGIVHTGKSGVRGLAALVGMPLEVVTPALAALLDDGCLRAMEGGYVFPNFLNAQEAKSSDAQRKREQRARDRDKALASGASGSAAGLDIEAAMSRSAGHNTASASRPGVTYGRHASTDNVTDVTDSVTPSRAVPCRAEPSSPSETAARAASLPEDDIPQAHPDDVHPAEEAEPFALEPQASGKKPRNKPPGERLYERLEARRREACEGAGLPFIESKWPHGRQNRDLGPIARLEESKPEEFERFKLAFFEFLDDPNAREADVPWPLDWFWKARARYEGRALKAQQGSAA
jgi:hypothetical protein